MWCRILVIIFIGLFFLFIILGITTKSVLADQCAIDMCDGDPPGEPSRIANCCPQGGLVPCGTTCCPCTLCDLFIMIGDVISFLLISIIPPLAALMVAIGGFMYIFAYAGVGGGGSEWLNRANTLFKSVIIGLIIAYGSWLIVEAFFATIGVKPMFRDWHTIC